MTTRHTSNNIDHKLSISIRLNHNHNWWKDNHPCEALKTPVDRIDPLFLAYAIVLISFMLPLVWLSFIRISSAV